MMIYDRVKALAKKRNVSIRKIEIDCGFSQGSVCKWNEVSPSAEKVKKVADPVYQANAFLGRMRVVSE